MTTAKCSEVSNPKLSDAARPLGASGDTATVQPGNAPPPLNTQIKNMAIMLVVTNIGSLLFGIVWATWMYMMMRTCP